MLSAICFDDQTKFQTNEIHDKRADRFLAFEFQTHKTLCPEMEPQTLFSLCLIASQVFGAAQ